ncbi:MAG TPA: diaminopimelate epimerase [Anaerolineales bacterium]|nr:diaminopimelate epimerase [Anaerolineales bacterium]
MTRHPVPFRKYHALGNDYLVLESQMLTAEQARAICHRNYGVGADGVLLPLLQGGEIGLKIFNPDGSIAEKSGNGLRIFTQYLFDSGKIPQSPVQIRTDGGWVQAQVLESGWVRVDMGRVQVQEQLAVTVLGVTVSGWRVNVGNPHFVVTDLPVNAETAQRLGASIEHAPAFPQRTNVQWIERIDSQNLRLEIWERGAGYTLASGSSSCAAAAVAHCIGWCNTEMTVHMPGGSLQVVLGVDGTATQSGAVRLVCWGEYLPAW